jgi:hypothetical protein
MIMPDSTLYRHVIPAIALAGGLAGCNSQSAAGPYVPSVADRSRPPSPLTQSRADLPQPDEKIRIFTAGRGARRVVAFSAAAARAASTKWLSSISNYAFVESRVCEFYGRVKAAQLILA